METKDIMEIALYTGEILLVSGAEIYRVEDTIKRICRSYDLECECFVMPTGIFISTLGFGESRQSVSLMRRISKRTIDLHRIELINSFSRNLQRQLMSYDEAMAELKRIENGPYFGFATRLGAAALTAPVYTWLFKGSIVDGIVAMVISTIIYAVKEGISKIGFFQFFEFFISGIIAGGMTIAANKFYPSLNIDKTIIGAIMILVPGLAITNGIRDALYGDIVSSLSRIGEALLVVAAVGAGVGVMLTLGLRWM